ncbi:hypothetical protein [Paenibacillus sp. FSL L8-0708]|jgi:hypothetical protein|uniref:hypothetical protein n=1 Tax=Paenibacillus sp. FSL L8-0708 TaxID=2975311 RepID=UPI0030F8D4C6
MAKFIKVEGMRINVDHIKRYFADDDGEHTRICTTDGQVYVVRNTVNEIDEFISNND